MGANLMYLGWSLGHFKYFDCSILDWEPDHINHDLASEQGALARRIVKQLKGRSRKDIEKLIHVVDLVVQDSSNNEHGLDEIIKKAEIHEFIGPPTEASYSEIKTIARREEFVSRYGLNISGLLLLCEQYDLDSVKDYINIEWCEFFAICALCKLGEVLSEIESKAGYANTDAPYHHVKFKTLLAVSYYIFQAYDLITISERFNDKDDFFIQVKDSDFKKKISLNNQVNIRKRHAPANNIKDSFIAFYDTKKTENSSLSRSAAATEFYRSLSPSEQRTLTPSRMEGNAIRTLTRALRERTSAKQ